MYIIYANEIKIIVTLESVYEYPDELSYQQNHCYLHYFFLFDNSHPNVSIAIVWKPERFQEHHFESLLMYETFV